MQSAINRFIKKLFDAVWSFGALQGVWIFWEQNIEDNKILIRYDNNILLYLWLSPKIVTCDAQQKQESVLYFLEYIWLEA